MIVKTPAGTFDNEFDEIVNEMDEIRKRLGLDKDAIMENYCDINDQECKGCSRSKYNEPCLYRYMQNSVGHERAMMVSKRKLMEYIDGKMLENARDCTMDYDYRKGYKEAMYDIVEKIKELAR